MRLFAHFEKYPSLLRAHREPWKQRLASCIDAAHNKLSKYYSKTEGLGGKIYNIACVLNPARKLSLYCTPAFESRYAGQYEQEVRDYYATHYAHLIKIQSRVASETTAAQYDLDALVDYKLSGLNEQAVSMFQQLDDYLVSALTWDKDPLLFWKNNEANFPGLAQMAKDFLSVPISGVGIERVCSQGQLMCPYQRNLLLPDTI
jgi:hypothetical protein